MSVQIVLTISKNITTTTTTTTSKNHFRTNAKMFTSPDLTIASPPTVKLEEVDNVKFSISSSSSVFQSKSLLYSPSCKSLYTRKQLKEVKGLFLHIEERIVLVN